MAWRSRLMAGMVVVLGAIASAAHAADAGYDVWVKQFSDRAALEGISPALVNAVLHAFEPDDEVIALDRRQPEDKLAFSVYRRNALNARRIAEGKKLMRQHAVLLRAIGKRYGVEPRFIVALFGMETDYSRHTGHFSVVRSLATLAYEGRRAELFNKELLAAFHIVQAGPLTADALQGSWAGAMGNCQFMPSSYIKYSVDWDKDGTADIWNSLPDTFASIAHYLSSEGWRSGIGWGKASTAADAVYPGTKQEGGYAVTPNFAVLLKWNRSRYFATSVGLLADALGR